MQQYQFEYKDMEFSKDGQLDELIALDRYAVPSYNCDIGDTVVAIVDEKGTKKIGVVKSKDGEIFEVEDRLGELHHVEEDLLQKPLELKPYQMWDRWARGASSVEKTDELKNHWENEFRWLFDGYRYSLGGRIQLMLGQEFVTGKKANLTAYNCFSGDTIIHTKNGAFFISELENTEVEALSFGGVYRKAKIKSFGEQELYEITLENGEKIKATAEHEWIVSSDGKGYKYNKKRLFTKDLEGHRIYVESHKQMLRNKNEVEKGIRHGVVFGDGTVAKNKNGNEFAQVLLFNEKRELNKYFEDFHQVEHHEDRYLGIYGLPKSLKELPSDNEHADYWYGFILGLMATDGHVDKRGHAMIHNSNIEVLNKIAKNMYKTGICFSSIKMTRKLSPFDNSYKPVYKIAFIKQTLSENDLLNPKHKENFLKSSKNNKRGTMKVVKVKPLGYKEEVYCGIEKETHTLVVGTGYLTGNCYVVESPKNKDSDVEQFLEVMRIAYKEASIMRRGGGVGLNISHIKTSNGSKRKKGFFKFYLPKEHKDYNELKNRIELGKFNNVEIIHELNKQSDNLLVGDSVDDLFKSINEMIVKAYDENVDEVVLNFSDVRHRDAIVKGVNGRSSGAVSWMELFVLVAELLQRDTIDNVEFAEIYSHIVHLIIQGGCVAPYTKIMTNKGTLTAEEIYNSDEEFYALTHKGYKKITHKFNNGKKNVYRIKTKHGYTIDASADHKFNVVGNNGEIKLEKLSNLKEGQHLAILLGDNPITKEVSLNVNKLERPKEATTTINIDLPSKLNEDLAFLLGLYHANGYLMKEGERFKGLSISVAEDRKETLDKVVKIIEKLFNKKPNVSKGDGKVDIIGVYSVELAEFLIMNNLHKEYSHNVQVPEAIFNSPKHVLEAYLGGFFAGDGTNNGKKGGLSISTTSEEFAKQYQYLLLSLGVASNIYEYDRSKDGWRTLYNVSVTGNYFTNKYADILSPYTSKVHDKEFSKKDVSFAFPVNLLDRFKHVGNVKKMLASNGKNTSRRVINHIHENIDSDDVNTLDFAKKLFNTVSSPIESIEFIEEMQVYDFEVEDVHMLSFDGFYTSNSRRGALMIVCNDDNENIEKFITRKTKSGFLSGANISVGISDSFMSEVKHAKENSINNKYSNLWNLIIKSAWKSAEPGVIFLERYNKESNSWYYAYIEATNPCGKKLTACLTLKIAELSKEAEMPT